MMTLEKYATILNGISDIVDRLGYDSRNIPVVFKGKVVPNRLCFHEYNDYVTLCDTHYYYDGGETVSGDTAINSNERIDPLHLEPVLLKWCLRYRKLQLQRIVGVILKL